MSGVFLAQPAACTRQGAGHLAEGAWTLRFAWRQYAGWASIARMGTPGRVIRGGGEPGHGHRQRTRARVESGSAPHAAVPRAERHPEPATRRARRGTAEGMPESARHGRAHRWPFRAQHVGQACCDPARLVGPPACVAYCRCIVTGVHAGRRFDPVPCRRRHGPGRRAARTGAGPGRGLTRPVPNGSVGLRVSGSIARLPTGAPAP